MARDSVRKRDSEGVLTDLHVLDGQEYSRIAITVRC